MFSQLVEISFKDNGLVVLHSSSIFEIVTVKVENFMPIYKII